ncbi:MAG: conjugal transfer mating pair stabilization protein TraN, partial [Deferribacteres bacterium]|nr:conjugal transfer mating pair stabilization protein TraN [Deferribacteres bacterium]
MKKKSFFLLSLLFLIISVVNAEEDFICLEKKDICKHAIDGNCVEWDYGVCTKATRTIQSYSAGCDLSNIMSMINQEHCDIEVTCNDPITVAGTCYRGSGCYPGYYYDDCPAGYDLRYTGNIQQKDCSEYGQTGTITLEKYEYGRFTGGSAMTLLGGGVTCQKYYSPRQAPSCAERLKNGERPAECYVNECANLESNPRCRRVDDLGTTLYGDEPTILNTDCVWVIDPVNGNVCTTDPNAIASLTDDRRLYDVKIEKYECDSVDVRNCVNKEYKMVCPDGSETLCQSQKECLEWGQETIHETTETSYILTRNYEVKTCVKGSSDCNTYINDPDCVYVGDEQKEIKNTIRFINGWDSDGDSKNCYIYYDGTCLEVGPDTSSWSACVNEFDSNLFSSISAVFPKTVVRVENERRVGGLSDKVSCFGSDNDAYDQYVDVDVTYIETFERYYCYTNYNTASVKSNCSPLNEELCLDYHIDMRDKSKLVCRKKEAYYECTDTVTKDVCKQYEERVICNDQSFPIPNVEMMNDNFTDFGNALGILGMLDDINSIWSGEYNYCSYGYFVNGFGGVYCNNCRGSGGFMCFQKKPEQQKAY